MGVPTFCTVHLKIHECLENSNKAISNATETKIKAKMARMLNPTAENEPQDNASKGTIQYILKNAKKNNHKIKNKLGLENEEGRSVGIDENDIKAKMARLRASVNQNHPETNVDTSPTSDQQDPGLQEIIDHAYRVNRGIERIKSPIEGQLPTIIDNIDLDQLNQKMKQKQVKKAVSDASKVKTSTKCQTKTAKTRTKVTNSSNQKTKSKANSAPKANPKTVTLTTDEIEALITKAVQKAITAEKNDKKKRGG
ncbi:hypothetical protein [Spiroplasma endosymbiont of Stenodema calcarata]|uniref:hypothetical protein n=1 Tax=Spiroplasma endosymbiont of Stenodema calcarata TaxID=3139328 RepID=UPI003CCAD9A3